MTQNSEEAGPHLIVMLTYNDFTVENAEEVFEQCKDSKALYWGMKEKPLPADRMIALYARMRECGKRTALEVVGYDEPSGMKGAELAAQCGCDILMGTKFHRSIAQFCNEHNIVYMPFAGMPQGRPSVLTGSVEDMIADARTAVIGGAGGVDLLGYRYTGDAVDLNKRLVAALDAPVCIAGSIDSFSRLDEVKATKAWGFTIGSAFFDHKFGDTMPDQIDRVVDYLKK